MATKKEIRESIDRLSRAIDRYDDSPDPLDADKADEARELRDLLEKRLSDMVRKDNGDTGESGLIDSRGAGGITDAEARSFDRYLRTGQIDSNMRMSEYRDAQSSSVNVDVSGGSGGGYLIPVGFWQRLAIALKQYGGLSQLYYQLDTPTGATMTWPTIDPTTTIASLLTENDQVSSTSYNFGIGNLYAWTYAELILCSIQLVKDSAFDVSSFCADRLGEACGRALAAHAVTGTGASEPLGILPALTAAYGGSATSGGMYKLTAATNVNVLPGTSGSTAGSDTTEPNTITELELGMPSLASLIAIMQSVDVAYRSLPGTAWVMSDAQHTALRQMTDGFGRPLLEVGVVNANVTELLGYPIVIDNNMSAAAAGTDDSPQAAGPVFGNFKSAMVYRQVGREGVEMMRLVERFSDYLQVGFLGWLRADIRSNDLRAVACPGYVAT